MLPNGASIPCADVSIDDVTNSVYVRLLADRELTMIGKYGIMFNLKLANGVMYSSPMVVFAEVSADAEVEYKELNISLGVALTYLPANVAYTGASPKIGPNGTWLVYNDELNAYEDTGEPANYGGVLGEVQSLKDIIETSLTPHFITNAVKVDWGTIGKNADGELCYIGAGIGDNEGNIDIAILEGYLTDKGYAKHIDIAKEYATKEWVEKKKFITIDSLPQKISAFTNDKGYITLDALAPYAISATTLGGYGITNAYTKTETDARIFGEVKRLFEDPRFVTAAVNIDGRTIKRDGNGALYVDETALSISGGGGGGGVADSVHWNNVTGKPSWIGSTKPTYKYSEIEERPDLSVYFLASNFTKANIKSTLGISDWALASAKPTYKYSEISNTPDLSVYALNTDLAKKWTQNDAKIANWDSAYSWGNHAAAGYAKASDVTNEFKNYVKLAGDSQSITAQHNFANGLKIGGVALRKVDNYLYLDSSLVLSGGVTMYGDDGTTVKPIWESIPFDRTTIDWVNGKWTVVGGVGSGGISEEFLNAKLQAYQPLLSATNKLPYSLISGTPDLSVYALKTTIPTKLSQLTDDVVSGKYLLLSGGTVKGSITTRSNVYSWANAKTVGHIIAGHNAGVSAAPIISTALASGGYGKLAQVSDQFGLYAYSASDSTPSVRLALYPEDGEIRIMGNTIPMSTTTYNLGSASAKWSNVYATSFIGDLTGTASGNLKIKAPADTLPSLVNIGGYGYENKGWNTTGPAITFGGSNYKAGFQSNYSSGALYFGFAKTSDADLGDWKRVAFTDSNVASATKLATARTIWGQSFDGTKDVTGAITVDGDATFSSKVVIGTIPVYQSADGTLFVDANVVFRGGVAMFGNTTTTVNEE